MEAMPALSYILDVSRGVAIQWWRIFAWNERTRTLDE